MISCHVSALKLHVILYVVTQQLYSHISLLEKPWSEYCTLTYSNVNKNINTKMNMRMHAYNNIIAIINIDINSNTYIKLT